MYASFFREEVLCRDIAHLVVVISFSSQHLCTFTFDPLLHRKLGGAITVRLISGWSHQSAQAARYKVRPFWSIHSRGSPLGAMPVWLNFRGNTVTGTFKILALPKLVFRTCIFCIVNLRSPYTPNPSPLIIPFFPMLRFWKHVPMPGGATGVQYSVQISVCWGSKLALRLGARSRALSHRVTWNCW